MLVFFALLYPVVAVAQQAATPAESSHAEVLIRPYRTQDGQLHITCYDSTQIQEQRLVVTALLLEVSTSRYTAGAVDRPHLVGWLINGQKPTQELWVGVELQPGEGSGKVVLALPALLKHAPGPDREVSLFVKGTESKLRTYTESGRSNIIFAPVRVIRLEFDRKSGLKLKNRSGWSHESTNVLYWEAGSGVTTGLIANFQPRGAWDTWFTLAIALLGGVIFGMFFTHHLLLPFIPRKPVIILLAVVLLLLDFFLWFLCLLLQYELLLGFAGGTIGLVVGIFVSDKLLKTVRKVIQPVGTSS